MEDELIGTEQYWVHKRNPYFWNLRFLDELLKSVAIVVRIIRYEASDGNLFGYECS